MVVARGFRCLQAGSWRYTQILVAAQFAVRLGEGKRLEDVRSWWDIVRSGCLYIPDKMQLLPRITCPEHLGNHVTTDHAFRTGVRGLGGSTLALICFNFDFAENKIKFNILNLEEPPLRPMRLSVCFQHATFW